MTEPFAKKGRDILGKRFEVRLSAAQKERVRSVAAARGVTVGDLVREAIDRIGSAEALREEIAQCEARLPAARGELAALEGAEADARAHDAEVGARFEVTKVREGITGAKGRYDLESAARAYKALADEERGWLRRWAEGLPRGYGTRAGWSGMDDVTRDAILAALNRAETELATERANGEVERAASDPAYREAKAEEERRQREEWAKYTKRVLDGGGS